MARAIEQMSLISSDGLRFEVPSASASLKNEYPDATEFLESLSFWQDEVIANEKARCGLIDLFTGRSHFFNPHTFILEEPIQPEDVSLSQNLNGLLVLSDSSEPEIIGAKIAELSPGLSPSAPVIVIEEKDGINVHTTRDSRKETLKELGLVEGKILVQTGKPNLVWRARTRREVKKRKGFNALEENPEWRQNWVRGKIQEGAGKYRDEGFTPLNACPAENQLRNTFHLRRDINGIEDGFGYQVEASCGCQLRIDTNGNQTRTLDCGDSDCDGMLPITKAEGDELTIEFSASRFLISLGISDVTEGVLPYLKAKHLTLQPGSFGEKDLGRVVASECGCQDVILRIEMPDSSGFDHQHPNEPWPLTPEIIAARFDLCGKHQMEEMKRKW